MCPSYQATMDEAHSPRGRSRLLFEMLERTRRLADQGGLEVRGGPPLDLCLACKGCKSDCPAQCRHGDVQGGVPCAALQGTTATSCALFARLAAHDRVVPPPAAPCAADECTVASAAPSAARDQGGWPRTAGDPPLRVRVAPGVVGATKAVPGQPERAAA